MNEQKLIQDAISTPDRDAFVSDWALSSAWGDEPTAPIPVDRVQYLAKLWEDVRKSVAELRAMTGLTQGKFAAWYGIPPRTVQNWESGASNAPEYVRLMLVRLVRQDFCHG